MRDYTGLMDAMKAADVIFDPSGAEKAPFSTEVEMLLGGIPQVYSPRLFPGEMEEFCKDAGGVLENLARRRRSHVAGPSAEAAGYAFPLRP